MEASSSILYQSAACGTNDRKLRSTSLNSQGTYWPRKLKNLAGALLLDPESPRLQFCTFSPRCRMPGAGPPLSLHCSTPHSLCCATQWGGLLLQAPAEERGFLSPRKLSKWPLRLQGPQVRAKEQANWPKPKRAHLLPKYGVRGTHRTSISGTTKGGASQRKFWDLNFRVVNGYQGPDLPTSNICLARHRLSWPATCDP